MNFVSDIFGSIRRFVAGFFNTRNYDLQHFTAFLLVLMCIQYIPIETRAGVSPVKVAVMGFSVLVLLRHFVISKALIWGMLYWLWVFITAAILHPDTYRSSTVMYLGMFVITFITFYNAVWNYKVFTLDYFITFVRRFIYVLVGVLILQQICLLAGMRLVPILNLCQILNRGIGANSLTFEPSTFARLMLVLYYAYLKCNEYKQGSKITIVQAIQGEHRLATCLFLWAMFTMGSGTAFVCLAVLSLYFMKGWYFLLSIPIFVGTYFILDYMEVTQFKRAQTVAIALQTADAQDIRDADGSASSRIAPMLNTLKIDLTDSENWIGHGCDYSYKNRHTDQRYLGDISDYGLIAYILGYLLIFNCSYDFWSLATLMGLFGVGGGISNISYTWGLLMILSVVKFMHKNRPFK